MLFAFFQSPKAHAQSLSVELSKRMYAGGYNITCHGGSDGRVSAQVSGGTAPYTISWNTGATGTPLDNIPAGTYTVTVTDANNATVSASITLIQPSALGHEKLVSSYNGYQISAYGAQTGSIQITPTGGTPPYTVDWGNNITGQIRENLGMGTYSYTITDANACSQQGSQVMNQPDELIISFSNIQGVSCYEGENGSVQTTVSGGVGPYAYNWDNGSFAQNPENLSAGEHTLMVEDGNAYKKTVTVSIPGPDKLNIDFQLSQFNNGNNVGCYSCHDGSISTTVSGGTAPYTYEWNDPLGSTTANLSQLSGGNYAVTVTDANQCTQKTGVELRMPAFEGWSMQGNTGTDPNTQFIGTADSADVVMKVNNGEVMRLEEETIKILKPLDFSTNSQFIPFSDSSSLKRGLLIRPANVNYPLGNLTGPLTLNVCGWTSPSFQLINDGFFKSFSNSNFNGSQLSVGSDGNQGVIEVSNGDIPFSNPRLIINHACGGDVFIGKSNAGSLIANHRIGVRISIPEADLHVEGTTILNGNVRIGNAPSTAANYSRKLVVEGVVYSREFRVTDSNTVWPDFVFAKDHKLMSLDSLSKFIFDFGHLPDVPSQVDIKAEGGYSIDELIRILLQKQEESTLHLLELNSRIKQLEKENQALRQIIEKP
jgi:hypothetical protein